MSDTYNPPAGSLPAKQARSEQTTQNIVAALERLLGQKTFEQVTMAELAAEAGLSAGAIYRRFKNKEALLPHIFERYRLELGAWMERVTSEFLATSGSLEHAVQSLIEETLDCFQSNAPIFRTVHIHGRLNPELNAMKPNSMMDYGFEPVAGLLERFREEVTQPLQTAKRYLSYVVVAMVMERALYPNQNPSAGLDLSEEQFVEVTSAMVYSWLTRPIAMSPNT